MITFFKLCGQRVYDGERNKIPVRCVVHISFHSLSTWLPRLPWKVVTVPLSNNARLPSLRPFFTLLYVGAGTVVSQSRGDKFIRNTLRNNGASVGFRTGYASKAKLNDISRTCWGMLQHDGAGIQSQIKRQTNLVMEQNWVYDSPKYGLRFDGGPPKIGRHGTMRRNVIRKTNGMMVKGDEHTVDHNLIFHKFTKSGDHDGQGSKCNLCVLR